MNNILDKWRGELKCGRKALRKTTKHIPPKKDPPQTATHPLSQGKIQDPPLRPYKAFLKFQEPPY